MRGWGLALLATFAKRKPKPRDYGTSKSRATAEPALPSARRHPLLGCPPARAIEHTSSLVEQPAASSQAGRESVCGGGGGKWAKLHPLRFQTS